MNEKILKKYLRDENNEPFGCVIALNKNQLGYSLCNKSKGDKFNKSDAFKIAYSRAISQKEANYDFWKTVILRHLQNSGYNVIIKVPKKDYNDNSLFSEIILTELKIMQERANRYYKGE